MTKDRIIPDKSRRAPKRDIDGVFLYKKNATGISTATISEPAADAAVYSLSGQKVGAGYHGVVIKNGRKYIQ